MKLIFDWDERKARRNRTKHKVSFDEARSVFGDRFLVTFPDEKHSQVEERLISIGTSELYLWCTLNMTKMMRSSLGSSMQGKQRRPSAKPMKKEKTENETDQMRPEFDLAGKKGVRGKYYQAYRQGHSVRIHKANGSINVKYFTLEDGAVMLEPDVRKHFPDSRSVNRALRKLIPIKPPRRRANHGAR